VSLPAELKGEPGVFVIVKAETDCATLRWLVLDAGLSLIPPELLKDSRTAVVMAGQAGRFRLLAFGAKGDLPTDPAVCTIIVGSIPPPVPPTPPPSDPLSRGLLDAFHQEPAADQTKLSLLLGLYRAAVQEVQTANQPTLLAFKDATKQARISLIGEALPRVRAAITAELDHVLPRSPTVALTAENRKLCAETFARIVKALEGIPQR
jgi:hypothetical protein